MRQLGRPYIVLTILLSIAITHAPASAADRLRVGLSSTSATLARLWVARDKGLFSKYGIDAELISIGGGGGGNRTIAALMAGDIQFSIGDDGSVRAVLRGVQTILDFVAQDEPKAKGADAKSFVDESFVREVEAGGFIKALYGR